MKEKELREAARCGCCKKLIGHTGAPMFYRVTVETHVLNVPEIRRQDGLALMLGSSSIAAVMGVNADMTQVASKKTITVCLDCCVNGSTVAEVVEADA